MPISIPTPLALPDVANTNGACATDAIVCDAAIGSFSQKMTQEMNASEPMGTEQNVPLVTALADFSSDVMLEIDSDLVGNKKSETDQRQSQLADQQSITDLIASITSAAAIFIPSTIVNNALPASNTKTPPLELSMLPASGAGIPEAFKVATNIIKGESKEGETDLTVMSNEKNPGFTLPLETEVPDSLSNLMNKQSADIAAFTTATNEAVTHSSIAAQNGAPVQQASNEVLSVMPMSTPTLGANINNGVNVLANSSSVISPRVNALGWDQALGQKISWMITGGQQSASLTLNPPDLGPLQVVIHVNNQQADATFISQQPEVRAALESAVPKLREMMEQSGIQLGECNVNSQEQHQQEFARQSSRSTNQVASISGSEDSMKATNVINAHQPALIRRDAGLVDTFV